MMGKWRDLLGLLLGVGALQAGLWLVVTAPPPSEPDSALPAEPPGFLASEAEFLRALAERTAAVTSEALGEEPEGAAARRRRTRELERATALAEVRRKEIRREIAAAAEGEAAPPQAAANEAWWRAARWRGAGLAFLGAALAFAVLRLRLAPPLRRLERTLAALQAGQMARLGPGAPRELRTAFERFDRLADGLSARRRDLEGEVERKTAQLARALEGQRRANDELRGVLRELERAQDRLAEREKTAALGVLARGIAHEFNNLLGGIAGCTREVHEELQDAELRELTAVILRAAERGRRIVDALRTYGRGGEGEARPVALDGLLAEAAQLARPAAKEKGAELAVAPVPGLRVLAVAQDVVQILLNLLQNAVQAAPPGSRIEVAASASAEGGCRVLVTDEGAGVAPEHRARLFEPFFTTREKEGGTGLGLALSHGLARRWGGELRLVETDRPGACFELRMPAAP